MLHARQIAGLRQPQHVADRETEHGIGLIARIVSVEPIDGEVERQVPRGTPPVPRGNQQWPKRQDDHQRAEAVTH